MRAARVALRCCVVLRACAIRPLMQTSSSEPRYRLPQRLALWLLPPLGAALIRLLGMTLRFRDIGPAGAHADEHPETRAWCLWHRSLLCIAWHFRARNIAILISPSFDGELIARTIRHVGYTPVRGSSSRSGAAGLLGLQRALQSRCRYAALTVDGPRGPVYRAKAGAVKLAAQIGGGAGVFYAAPVRAWELHSWDRFLIPKPFTTIVIGWQPAVPVPADADEAAIEAARSAVEQSLERARAAVEAEIARLRRQ